MGSSERENKIDGTRKVARESAKGELDLISFLRVTKL